jgi:hypothetical protein
MPESATATPTLPQFPQPPNFQAMETPTHEASRRAADQAPIFMLPHALALDNQKKIWTAANRRVDDSHKVQMKALGLTPDELTQPSEDEEMGVNVQGDTIHQTYNYNAAAPAIQPATQPTIGQVEPAKPADSSPSLFHKCLPLILAAGCGAAPATGLALYQWFHKPTPAVVAPNANYTLGIEVKDQP